MEDKSEKFIRLAERRMTDVINKLRLIGNLSNRRNYTYEKEQVDELIRAIENETKKLKQSFYSELEKKENIFRFKK